MARRRCSYCPRDANTVDHIIPKAWAGRRVMEYDPAVSNLKPACEQCNRLRADCGHCPGAMAALRAMPLRYRPHYLRSMRRAAKQIIPPRWLWWQRVA